MAAVAACLAILLTGNPGHRGLSPPQSRRHSAGITALKSVAISKVAVVLPGPPSNSPLTYHVPSDFVFEVDGLKGSPTALTVQTHIHIDSFAAVNADGNIVPRTNLPSIRVLMFTNIGWIPAPKRIQGPATVAVTAN